MRSTIMLALCALMTLSVVFGPLFLIMWLASVTM